MKNPFNRLASLVSLLGLITILTGLVIMVVLPAIRIAAWAILGLGIVLMIAALIIDFRKVSSAVTGRRGRFSTGSTVMTSIFIGITLVVNAISIGAYHRFDTTGLSQFTLTAQTKDVLANMKTPVKVLCFFVPNDPTGIGTYALDLLKEYQNYTDKLTVTVIDPDAHPDQANQYGITMYQTIVFENNQGQKRLVSPNEIVQIGYDSQGNQQIVGVEAEHAFTSAILEVTGVTQKKIYFLTGHGEADINADYKSATQALRDNLFMVGTLDLLLSHAVPDDAAALVIAGPTKPLDDTEIGIIKTYLDNGGWVMVMLNPDPTSDMRNLLAPWGLDIEDGTMVDTGSSLSTSVTSPIIPRLRDFFGLTSVYFPGTTAFLPQAQFKPQVIPSSSSNTPIQIVYTSNVTDIEMISLARTSSGSDTAPSSWLEKNYDATSKPTYTPGTDIPGPLDLALLIVMQSPVDQNGQPIRNVPATRLVVVGNSTFASNNDFYNGDNGNFFLNLVEVLTSGKELVTIERKVMPFRQLVVGPDTANFIRVSSIGLLPVLVLIMGGVIWWRRR